MDNKARDKVLNFMGRQMAAAYAKQRGTNTVGVRFGDFYSPIAAEFMDGPKIEMSIPLLNCPGLSPPGLPIFGVFSFKETAYGVKVAEGEENTRLAFMDMIHMEAMNARLKLIGTPRGLTLFPPETKLKLVSSRWAKKGPDWDYECCIEVPFTCKLPSGTGGRRRNT